MLISGLILMLKKDVAWIQPATVRGSESVPQLGLQAIYDIASGYPELALSSWADVNRLDIRPAKGVVKLRSNSHWELQLDLASGAPLHLAYRRSDIIESIHDGSFFHDKAKYWVFLPASIVLLLMWVTGMLLYFRVRKAKLNKKARLRQVPNELKPSVSLSAAS